MEANTTQSCIKQAYLMASLRMADIIELHDFTATEKLVLHFVRKQSFGAGELEAYIPAYRFFGSGLRLTKSQLSLVVGSKEKPGTLRRQEIIEECPEGFYGFRFPWENWKVATRAEMVEVIRQLELLERPPSIPNALREVFVEHAAADPGRDLRRPTVPSGPANMRRGVTESVTPLPPDIPLPNRQQPASLGKIGVIEAVADSVTPHVTMQHCSNVKETLLEHCNNVTCPPVTDSVTVEPLTEYQQRLFNECKSVGAFGPDNESRGCWYGFAKSRPEVLDWLLGEYRYAKQLGRVKKGAGPFMMSKWKWAGRPEK